MASKSRIFVPSTLSEPFQLSKLFIGNKKRIHLIANHQCVSGANTRKLRFRINVAPDKRFHRESYLMSSWKQLKCLRRGQLEVEKVAAENNAQWLSPV